MDREETLRLFEPLRRKAGKYKPVMLTTAELADSAKTETTVTRISNLSIEDVVGASSTLRLNLKQAVDNLVGQIDGERLNLEEVKTVKAQLSARLENARSVRIAADALEVEKQRGEEKLAQLDEEFNQRVDSMAIDKSDTESNWGQAQRRVEAHEAAQDTQRNLINSTNEETYTYTLTRNRQQAVDNRALQRRDVVRQLTELAEARTREFDAREQVLQDNLGDIKADIAEIQTIQEKLKTQPGEVRGAAIKRIHSDAESQAKLLSVQREASKITTAAEIVKITEQNDKQAASIQDLEKKISEATGQNKALSTAAMPASKAS